MCTMTLTEMRKSSKDNLVEKNDFNEVYSFVKQKIMYLHVAIDNYKYIFATNYKNYFTFARISPAFINMVGESIVCGVYTTLAELVKKNTVVGVITLVEIAQKNYINDTKVQEVSNDIIKHIEQNDDMIKDLIKLRNKEISHFDENALIRNTVKKNALCLNIGTLKQFIDKLEDLISQLRSACKKDNVHETMCPINGDDSKLIKDIIDTYMNYKSDINQLKKNKPLKNQRI